MSSWEGEPDAHARGSGDGDDPVDARASSNGGPSAGRAAPGGPVPHPPGGLGLVPADERGVDPFPSVGSLVWAPEPTEAVPVVPSDPTEPQRAHPPAPPFDAPDPSDQGPHSASLAMDWPAPSGAPLSSAGREASRPAADIGWHATATQPEPFAAPPPQAYADEGERPAHFAGGGSRPGSREPGRRLRTDRLALGVVGAVVIVAVAALLLVPDGDGSDAPDQPSTGSTVPVDGDATDPAGPIVGPTGVIGSWSGSEWLPRAEGEQAGAGLDYTILGLGDTFDTASGEAVDEECGAQRSASGTDVAVDLGAPGDGPPTIAVAGVREPRPRPVEQLSTDAPIYQQAATEVAAGLGATTPPTLTQLLRADLDGNGTDEIVVSAEHIADPDGLAPSAGDWSVVFLRRVAAGGVATDVLASSIVGGGSGAPGGDRLERIQVATLADLNRDGAMEIALAGRSAAGGWTAIHAVGVDGTTSEVLRAGCDG